MNSDERFRQGSTAPCPPPASRPPILAGSTFGDVLQISGQTAVDDNGILVGTGILGVELDLLDGRRCAWQCAANVLRAAVATVGSLEQISGVRMVQVLMAATPEFTEHHLVADAASEFLLTTLGPRVGQHTRLAVGVSSLPTGSPVEVVASFWLRRSNDDFTGAT